MATNLAKQLCPPPRPGMLTSEPGEILASAAIQKAHSGILQAAAQGRRVILIGPSGSGKERLAGHYHRASGRSGRLVTRNCALFSKDLVRCELFGAEEGAYTGATRRIIGAVEQAHGGTLFLDEVAELPLDLQAMLLRFLDCGEYERIGSYGQTNQADLLLICATNRDLRSACLKGEFRSDLWYRLAMEVIDVPPLCQRPEDLLGYLRQPLLAGGVTPYECLDPQALALVLSHPWDGNFRELANFVARLPDPARRGGVDGLLCCRLLRQGALTHAPHPAQSNPAPPCAEGWPALARLASQAFAEDHQKDAPQSWNEVLEYVEQYWKPLIFAHLSGIRQLPRLAGEYQTVAARLEANRGTAQKQIQRYFQRFKALAEGAVQFKP